MTQNFQVDYDLLLRNINELNVIAGEGVSKIEKTKDGARLKVRYLIFHSHHTCMSRMLRDLI